MARQGRDVYIRLIVSDMGLGGAQRAAATLANGFAAQGHRVELVETYSAGGECTYYLSPHVRRAQWAVTSQRAGSKLMSRLQRLFWLRGLFRERSDAVIISFLTDVNVATILASLKLPVTTIVTERSYPGMVPLPSWLSWLRRRLYSHAAMVIGQTQVAAEWLSREIPSATVRVMPNPLMLPVDSNQPHRSPDLILGQKKRLILAVGRLSEEKGFSVLLNAYAGLSDASRRSASLVILGEGPARQPLEQQIHHLNLNEQVFLPGPAGNLGDWYKRADVFVLSSRFEGFPNALLEAQGYGVACVSFDCLAGPADLIEHGRTGLLVNPESGVAGLAEAIANLLSNDDKRKQIGMAAKAASQQFETSQIIAKWENLIAEIKEEKNS